MSTKLYGLILQISDLCQAGNGVISDVGHSPCLKLQYAKPDFMLIFYHCVFLLLSNAAMPPKTSHSGFHCTQRVIHV